MTRQTPLKPSSTGIKEYLNTLGYMRKQVFPKLSNKELLNYALLMRGWFNDQFKGIEGDDVKPKETLPPPPGDETGSSWGKPGWGEMGG